MATLWEKIRHFANEKVKRKYMNRVRHDRKCPNCKMWTSEVGGCCSIDYSNDDHIEIMKCRQCGYKSKWDCRGMVPTLHDQQDSHTPKADGEPK